MSGTFIARTHYAAESAVENMRCQSIPSLLDVKNLEARCEDNTLCRPAKPGSLLLECRLCRKADPRQGDARPPPYECESGAAVR